jgi:hypothetical protein
MIVLVHKQFNEADIEMNLLFVNKETEALRKTSNLPKEPYMLTNLESKQKPRFLLLGQLGASLYTKHQ